MTPAQLRSLMSTAEWRPGMTTADVIARADAEHQLSSWRAWLPGLLATIEPTPGWRERGGRDPHLDIYECDRADLCGGHLTDDQVAYETAMLMRGDLNHEAVLCTAKDRIRWLSRRVADLEALLPIAPASQVVGGAPVGASCRSPAGAHSSEVSR